MLNKTIYRSVLTWPEEVKLGVIPNESTDNHELFGAALKVVRGLHCGGFGMDGSIFPLAGRVEKVVDGVVTDVFPQF